MQEYVQNKYTLLYYEYKPEVFENIHCASIQKALQQKASWNLFEVVYVDLRPHIQQKWFFMQDLVEVLRVSFPGIKFFHRFSRYELQLWKERIIWRPSHSSRKNFRLHPIRQRHRNTFWGTIYTCRWKPVIKILLSNSNDSTLMFLYIFEHIMAAVGGGGRKSFRCNLKSSFFLIFHLI